MIEKEHRFKRVLRDGTFFFETRKGFDNISHVFMTAFTMARVELDVLYVDVYDDDKKIATFYK